MKLVIRLLCFALVALPGIVSGQAKFVSAGSLRGPRDLAAFAQMADGRIFIAGGKLGNSAPSWALGTTEIYDPATGVSTAGPNLAQVRYGACAARLSDGRIAIIGGEGNNFATADKVELYDPATGTMQLAGLLPQRVYAKAIALRDGRVLVAGGMKNDMNFPVHPELWMLTFSGTGMTYQTVHEGYRHNPSLTMLTDGRIFIAGGSNEVQWNIQTAKIFNPATNTLASAGNMSTGRFFHSATLMADGRVFLAGGRNHSLSDSSSTAKCDIYNPVTNTWVTHVMLNERAFHWAGLQPDGRIVIDGREVFNPANSTFTPTGAVTAIPRGGAHVFPMPDGRQLILGGNSSSGPVTAVEFFLPEGWAVAQPPVANAGSDQFVFAGSANSAAVALDGSASTDPEQRPLSFRWTGPGIDVTGATPTVTLPLGIHSLTLHVANNGGKSATDAIQVAVVPGGDAAVVTQLQAQVAALLASLAECNNESQQLQANLATAHNQLASVTGERDMLRAERDAWLIERNSLMVERNAWLVERATLIAERDALLGERNQLRIERDALVAERDQLRAQRDTLQAQRDALQAERDSLQNQNAVLTAANVALQAERTALAAERDALIGERNQLRTERDGAIAERDQIRVQRDALQAQRDALQAERDSLQSQNATLSAANAVLQAERATLLAANQSLQTQLTQANAVNAALQGELQSLVQTLAAAFNDPAFSIPGATLAEQIANLVTAIENLNPGQQQALYKNLGGKK